MAIGVSIEYYFPGGGGGDCCFTDDQKDRLLDLIYENNITAFSVVPATGERGVNTPVTVNFNIQSKDDVFTAASINQGIGNVLPRVNAGAQAADGGERAISTVFTLNMAYNRKDVPTNESKNAQYTALVPQWSGATAKGRADWSDTDYPALSAALTKSVQASNLNVQRQFTIVDGYLWFVVAMGTGFIKDANGFNYPIGNWGDPATFWWRKPITLILNNGVTTATVWLIRTRESQTRNNTTFTHSNTL